MLRILANLNNNNVQILRQPDESADDPLTSLVQQGATAHSAGG